MPETTKMINSRYYQHFKHTLQKLYEHGRVQINDNQVIDI